MRHFLSLLLSICLSASAWADEDYDLSLRDKIGQMLIVGFDGKKVDVHSKIVKAIQKNNLGGVLLFDFDFHTKMYDKNIESPQQVKRLNRDLQYFTVQGNNRYHRPQLPLIISVDYEGGKVNRLDERYGFPPTLSAAKAGTLPFKEVRHASQSMTQTLKAAGFNLNFAPVLDVNVNPENPVIGKKERSFSDDPKAVSDYANVYSKQYRHGHIQCAYKHFPGHGSSTQDSHLGFVDVSNTWQPYELEPYQHLNTKEACGMVMSAHIVNRQLDSSGLPATLSYKILTELLRNQLHFNGVIVTDDMQMKAISDHYGLEQALVLSINAGADMLIFGNNLNVAPQDPEQLIDIIEAKVRTGEINRNRIDEAYRRIVALKKSIV
jgi:beta-N-acetylhexosaminidase